MKKIVLINLLITILLMAGLELAARVYVHYATGTSTAGLPERTLYLNYRAFTMWGDDLNEVVSKLGPPEDSTYRILLVGGSTAQGFPASILQNAFEEKYPGTQFEVINLGYGGYNARQEVIIASIWGTQLRPDILISLSGGNDIRHRLRMDRAGSHYLDDTYRFVLTNPFITPIAEIARKSQLVNGINRLLARRTVQDVSAYEDALPVFLEAQHSMNLLTRGACSQRVMVLQPLNAFKDPMSAKEVAFTRYKYREAVVMALYDRANAGLESLARKDGVMYLDGRNIYDGMEETIFSDDVHFRDDKGYKILARHIASLTNERQMVRHSGCPPITEQQT
jgi:hypothetical protein